MAGLLAACLAWSKASRNWVAYRAAAETIKTEIGKWAEIIRISGASLD